MRFYLDNDTAISDHDVATAIMRHDLIPIPVTLELTVNATPNVRESLAVGRRIFSSAGVVFVIVKSQVMMGSKILDGYRTGAIHIIAVLDGCEALVHATKNAINLKNTSMTEIYRACGAKVGFGNDIQVDNFVCFKGMMASERIAWALQKEAACVMYDTKLHIRRIDELLATPSTVYDPSAVQWLSHAHTDGDISPHHLSVAQNGTDILGNTPHTGSMDYVPRCNERQLANLSKILIARGVIERSVDESLMAGKTLSINDETYLVVTSAIIYHSGAFGGGNQLSMKSWLYNLGNNDKHRQLIDTP